MLKELAIHYFSGTGNSKNVAHWVAGVAKENGISCDFINIADTDRLHIKKQPTDALLFFISPIHGFNYPPVMLHYLFRFPKGKNEVVLMNTRAGMLIGRWVTPGLTGIAFYLAWLVLRFKGYRIIGMLPIDLPSNWISLHPGLNRRTVQYLHQVNKERVNRFASVIFSGKTAFKVFHEILQDLAVLPIAILYYIIGRFVLSKTYVASLDCNRCGICIRNCPVHAIEEIDHRPFWTLKCESCMRCMGSCPKKAIETAHGSIVLFSILFSGVFLAFFHSIINPGFSVVENRVVELLLHNGLYLLLFLVWYRVIHFLMRYRWFERIVVFTSLTKWKWWGKRYKALKP